MKIIVFSDMHEKEFLTSEFVNGEKKLAEKNGEKVIFVSLGDSELSDDFIKNHFQYYVKGLADKDSQLPELTTFDLTNDGKKFTFVLQHGSKLTVNKMDLLVDSKLPVIFKDFAHTHNLPTTDVCYLFGYTHMPTYVESANNVFIVNPGSAFEPEFGSIPCFMILTFDEKLNKITNFKIKSTNILTDYDEQIQVHI
ncbi:metallophosphoesterase family protein [Mycoplasmopsis columbinasalis]|uniref:Phosphodiesterase, MJ0936 family n=1 Tax=Mycoplasmopsis columbinasalis TaxID=114880 RepID=A0A449BAL5_9BACT|nr:metallophosphoesterase family protein [Mycoplasmopsis columbinasalis]VEU78207.1 phosphodiesterase, MJ0936 family [Mycoplasmopsis columbinasalis]